MMDSNCTVSENGPICPYCGKLIRLFAVEHESQGVVHGEEVKIACSKCSEVLIVTIYIRHLYVTALAEEKNG